MSDLEENEKSKELNDESLQEEKQENSTDISEISKKGYKLLRENKVEQAIECFMSILATEKDNNYALVGMGDAERRRGSCRDAVFYYEKCLEFHPGNNYALFGLADCYKAMDQYHKAIGIWKQYLLHDDKNISVLTRVADAYRKIRDYRNSKTIYLRVLKLEENNPYAIIGLGHLNYDFKEYNDALLYWTKMLEINPDNIDIRVLTSIGNCHRKLKTFASGIPYFEQALLKEKNNFYAIFGLADCYRGLNQHEKSIEYWNQILKQDPRNKVILTRVGDACRVLRDFEKAQGFYERALNIEFDTYAVLGLALISKAQDKFEEAANSLCRLIQQDSKSYRIYIELADCYLKNGNKQKAIEALEEYQRQGIRNAQVAEMLDKL
ncbi:MAG: tetratricopeptide repeat protein [Treponema sp.]|nr:tetratricopeptide repeat protein [Treponema sp.]